MRIIVTVDTEADDQWKGGTAITLKNIAELPRFQNLCETYEMPVTYFVTHEIAIHSEVAQTLRVWQDTGKAEIGAHLHPWTTVPLSQGESESRAFPSELQDEMLKAKLKALTEEITNTFGRAPTSYRAGRWGFDMRQATILRELGYLVDSSITPGISWKETKGLANGIGGPDFTRESVMPHMIDGILEVPMTILRVGLLRRKKWLRIFDTTSNGDLKKVINKAKKMGLPCVVFMTHSSELCIGTSPYVKTEAQLEHVYARLNDLFQICAEEKIEGTTMTAFARQFRPQ